MRVRVCVCVYLCVVCARHGFVVLFITHVAGGEDQLVEGPTAV